MPATTRSAGHRREAGDQTRDDEQRRILAAARACYLEAGCTGTAFAAVAARAEVTHGAVARCFRSQGELVLAVVDGAEEVVYGRLGRVATALTTFGAAVEAVLDEVPRLILDESAAVGVLALAEADFARSPVLCTARPVPCPGRQAFVAGLVDLALATGELALSDRLMMADLLAALLVGLWQTAIISPGSIDSAVDGLKRAITGQSLLGPSVV